MVAEQGCRSPTRFQFFNFRFFFKFCFPCVFQMFFRFFSVFPFFLFRFLTKKVFLFLFFKDVCFFPSVFVCAFSVFVFPCFFEFSGVFVFFCVFLRLFVFLEGEEEGRVLGFQGSKVLGLFRVFGVVSLQGLEGAGRRSDCHSCSPWASKQRQRVNHLGGTH